MKSKIFRPSDSFYHGICPKDRMDGKGFSEILQALHEDCKNEVATDWGNSLYTSQSPDVAYGYIGEGGQHGYVVELKPKEAICCISSSNEDYANGIVGEETPQCTKQAVYDLLGLHVKGAFMNFLGSINHVFECFHNQDYNKEVIIPSNMVEKFEVVSIKEVYFDINKREYVTINIA